MKENLKSIAVLTGLITLTRVFIHFYKNSQKQAEVANNIFALRLLPGEEIKSSLERVLQERKINGGAVISCVGSVSCAVLRLANATSGLDISHCSLHVGKPHEIVSLSGTLTLDGLHLHMSLSDELGQVVGGHLVNATVHTTCELVLVHLPTLHRKFDERTGFKELCA